MHELMKVGELSITVACCRCSKPITMGPMGLEEVRTLTGEAWGELMVSSTICDPCIFSKASRDDG